ncbi:hypothetical protein D9M69_486090 [compost metagenome]
MVKFYRSILRILAAKISSSLGWRSVMSQTNFLSNAERWGYIDKCDRAREHEIWVGVEACYSEGQGRARAAELEESDPCHEVSCRTFPGVTCLD